MGLDGQVDRSLRLPPLADLVETALGPVALRMPKLELAARNNPRLKVVRALGISVVDLLHHDAVVISEPAIQRLTEVLAP